jgi:hypothetical protein
MPPRLKVSDEVVSKSFSTASGAAVSQSFFLDRFALILVEWGDDARVHQIGGVMARTKFGQPEAYSLLMSHDVAFRHSPSHFLA